jgi:hypothetical protein
MDEHKRPAARLRAWAVTLLGLGAVCIPAPAIAAERTVLGEYFTGTW